MEQTWENFNYTIVVFTGALSLLPRIGAYRRAWEVLGTSSLAQLDLRIYKSSQEYLSIKASLFKNLC
jgi:hypothetical protein